MQIKMEDLNERLTDAAVSVAVVILIGAHLHVLLASGAELSTRVREEYVVSTRLLWAWTPACWLVAT